MRLVLLFFFVLTFIVTSEGYAGQKSKEYSATQIQVLDNSATMHEHDNGFVFFTSGPVGSEGIPEVISQGDKIVVDGKAVVANIIMVTLILEDMSYAGKVFARKGDVTCVVASTPEDFPGDEERDRLWIHVTKCKPLK